jgi:transcriptional regulator with XRE-family HTH domain
VLNIYTVRLVNQAPTKKNSERHGLARPAKAPDAMSSAMARKSPRNLLGDFIRNQREITRLSLRQLANLANVSNPYLSQIERGLFQPSANVLKGIANALGLKPEKLYAVAGWLETGKLDQNAVEAAIRTDSRLSASQKEALVAVYRGFLKESEE